jgi:hypothetical protein
VKLLNEKCVPVILNSFYGYNSQWFKQNGFMDGMWKNVRAGNGDWTVLTPDGQFLGREVRSGFAKWQALPAAQRKPGSWTLIKIDGAPKGAPPGPPPGAVVVRLHQRNLKKGPGGQLSALSPADTRGLSALAAKAGGWNTKYNDSFNDAMWLLEDEWKSLTPADPKPGDRFPLPEEVKKRMLLWHLTNRTFCVGIAWEEQDVRSENLSLVVESTAPVVRLRLEGSVLLKMDGSAADKKIFWGRTEHGYDARLLGFIEYDPKKGALTRFDVAALGDSWGGDNEGARHNVGRLPLGISFELASGESLGDAVLPCGGVCLDRYLKLRSQFK